MSHAKPSNGPCSHRVYHLNCDEYDRLWSHADGRCQICGTTPEQTKHGFLVVDHDAGVGQWAVRGLLCTNCNTALPAGSTPSDAADYLATPWWRAELTRLGASGDPAPEPPVGTTVSVLRVNFRRDTDGWKHVAKHGGAPRSWGQMNRYYGPHRIKVLDVPQVDDVSGWPREERRAYVVSALRAGVRPTEVTRVSGWTYATVRKMAREAGIEPDARYKERADRLRKSNEEKTT